MRCLLRSLSAAAAFALAIGPAAAQVGFPPPPPKVSPAAGSIDMHVHSHPDVFGRSMDDIDVATLAKAKGMRGILLKNHVANTADRAQLVMKVVPGIEVWGGIVLNNAVGGINPAAVEWMHRMYGGRGKVVWLPTFDSDKHIKTLVDKDKSGILVAPNGVVTPQMEEVLKIIARENLVLATGHIHAEEVVAVTKKARELGVKNIMVTHGLTNIPGLVDGAGQGSGRHGRHHRGLLSAIHDRPERPIRLDEALERSVGQDGRRGRQADRGQEFVLSTDLGQQGNMTHPDGMENMIAAMKGAGVSEADIDLMIRKNPAKLLGLDS